MPVVREGVGGVCTVAGEEDINKGVQWLLGVSDWEHAELGGSAVPLERANPAAGSMLADAC